MSSPVTVRLESGRPSSRRSLSREVGDLTLRVLTLCRRGGSRAVRTRRPMGPGSAVGVTVLVAWMTWSRAFWRAMVNPQRFGSVPGTDSAASTMTARSAW